MATDAEIAEKFWKALKSDMTLMLGLEGGGSEPQPMTAQIEGDGRGPIWTFTSKETDLVRDIAAGGSDAIATFASKGHDLFATLQGRLVLDNDRATIDRLWNPYVAAWFEGGKDDPKLQLIRFDAEQARIWLNAHSMIAGIKLLLGRDPKKDYEGKVANVPL